VSVLNYVPRVITIYIWKEITTPFFLGLLVLTLTVLLGKLLKLIELVINKGLSLSTFLKLIIFSLPFFLTYIIPIAFLLAVIVAYNRFSGDGEIIAFKASGMSLGQIAIPAAILSVVPFFIALFISLYAFPWGNLSFKKLLYNITTTQANMGLKEKIFIEDFNGLTIYIDKLSLTGKEMSGVFIIDEREINEPSIVTAKKGSLLAYSNPGKLILKLAEGNIHSEKSQENIFRSINFKNYNINLTPRLTQNSNVYKSHRELLISELKQRIEQIRKEGGITGPHIMDLHKRFTLPFSVFIFTIIGVALGVQRHRQSRLRGFTLALIVVVTYYLLSTFLEFLGEGGRLNPVLSVWGSNIILGIITIYIFYKSYKEQQMKIFVIADDLIERCSALFTKTQ
jgi:lipopolysaccharide export system permease protein